MRFPLRGAFTAIVLSALWGAVPSVAAAENSYLGIDVKPIESGLQITDVWAESPAALAGLRVGDVVVSVDGRDVRTLTDLDREVSRRGAGEIIVLKMARNGGATEDVRVVLKRAEGRPGASRGGATMEGNAGTLDGTGLTTEQSRVDTWSLGIEVADAGDDAGARITAIREDGPARGELERGDVIREINGARVRNAADVDVALRSARPGDAAAIQADREGASRRARIFLARHERGAGDEGRAGDARGKRRVANARSLFGIEVEEASDRVRVIRVSDDGPARGQLRAGDIITEIDGARMRRASDVDDAVAKIDADAAMLTIERDGMPHKLRIPLVRGPEHVADAGERTGDAGEEGGERGGREGRPGARRGGLDMGEIDMVETTLDRTSVGIDAEDAPDARGVRVIKVREDGPANGRLRVGDTIRELDGAEIRTVRDLDDAIRTRRAGDGIRLVVDRDGARQELRVFLARSGQSAERPVREGR